MKIPLPVLFALGTALCWGLYGPTLAQTRIPEKLYSPFKPYAGIGLAYIVWAFIGGMVAMGLKGDSFSFAGKHSIAGIWGFAAGTLGALGALSLTTALMSGGKPQMVMPIVFGGAVCVTAVASVITSHGQAKTSPWLWVGIAGMFVCILLVTYHTPHGHPPKKPAEGTQSANAPQTAADSADSS